MLFRRIAEHVKDQNWTAVGLDFVIVVVGVFFGMQVQSLYEEGARQNADKQYLERLHREVIELKEIRAELIEPRRKNLTALAQAAAVPAHGKRQTALGASPDGLFANTVKRGAGLHGLALRRGPVGEHKLAAVLQTERQRGWGVGPR